MTDFVFLSIGVSTSKVAVMTTDVKYTYSDQIGIIGLYIYCKILDNYKYWLLGVS